MKKLLFLFLISISVCSQTQIGNTLYGTGTAYSAAGSSVSLSSDGTIVAFGAPGDYPSNSGKVKVFRNINNVWTQIGSDIVGSTFDYLGQSVSLSSDGTTLAVGAAIYVAGETNNFGYVKVFKNINDVWTQIGSTIISEDDNTNFGAAIDLSSDGNVVAIGARFYSGNLSNIGKVKVFRNVNNVWTPIGNNLYGSVEEGYFGMSISLSSDGAKLAVGSWVDDKSVRVYENVNDTWTQIGNVISFGGMCVDLSSDGNLLAIGGPDFSINMGKVRLYTNVNGNFIQTGADFVGEHLQDYFGESISLSADGSVLAIGAPWYGQNNSRYGKVSIYSNTNQNWTLRSSIIGPSFDDWCGSSVALSSDGSIVAAGYTQSNGLFNQPRAGEVRVFNTAANLSNNSFSSDAFSVYPNPTSNILNINLSSDLVFEKATVYNPMGQIIKTVTTQNSSVNDLSKGIYFIEVQTNKGIETKSFIKE